MLIHRSLLNFMNFWILLVFLSILRLVGEKMMGKEMKRINHFRVLRLLSSLHEEIMEFSQLNPNTTTCWVNQGFT